MVFVRNVKFSAAECNSFNIRKKNVEDLASKKTGRGSHAKKQPSRCKVASFGVQSNTHHGAKLQTSGCNSKFFRFQFEISSIHQCDFFGFYCYLCHVCYAFYCLWIRNTKISEKSNMTNSWATFCCPGTYKK